MSDFGAGFKKARESLGISLDEIATETRISIRFLQAIESEEFERLPGGVFNRGFIRAYAVRVRLDPDRALAEYDHLVRPEETEAVLETAPRSERTRADIALYPIAVGALILLIVAFYVLTRNSGSRSVVTATPATAAAPVPVPVPAPVSATSSILPNITAETVVEAAPEPAPTPPQEQLVVEMTANQETWIRVLVDGSPFEAVLQAGDTRRFSAQESLDVTIGNAAGISLKVNDREVGALGRQGQVRAFVLTPANVAEIDKIIS